MKSPMAVRIETTWSEAEKKIARKAFDRAFERQCDTITEEAKRMLATSSPPHGKRADLAGLQPDKIELIESWMK